MPKEQVTVIERVLNFNPLDEVIVETVKNGTKYEILYQSFNNDGEVSYKTLPVDINGSYFYCSKCGHTVKTDEKPTMCKKCFEKAVNRAEENGVEIPTKIKCTFERLLFPPHNSYQLTEYGNYPKEQWDLKNIYTQIVKYTKDIVIFQKEIEYKVLALWIISTYKKNLWSTVGIPAFLSRKPNCGKSTALDVVRMLAYRAKNTGDDTFRSNVKALSKHDVTVLIDNIEGKAGKEFENFIDKNYKIGTADGFGFIAIAGTTKKIVIKESNLERMIPFYMIRDNTAKYNSTSPYEKKFDGIRSALLNYKYKYSKCRALEDDYTLLRGRIKEIFESILAVAIEMELNTKDIVKYAKSIEGTWDIDTDKDVEQLILESIRETKTERIYLDTIIKELGWDLTRSDKTKLGIKLSRLGIKTKHTMENESYIDVNLNIRTLRRQYKNYMIDM